jgi:hypothetical protein
MSSPAKREWIRHEYEAKRWQLKAHDPTKEIVYPNQAEAAQEIFKAFMIDNKVAATLIALPQAGKTGTFLETAYRMCTFNDDEKAIDPEQLLIITGMSDREWRWQTSDDMLTTFQKRVKHRGQFESVPTLLATLRNSLIIIDECHIAAEKEQSMSAMLRDAGLLNIDELRRRRIFLLEVSATPGATLYDAMNWGSENHGIVILKESPKYVGFRDFIAEKRLHESFDLTKPEEAADLIEFIEQTFPRPKYHIIRLSGRKSISTASNNIREHANARGWLVHNHNANERMWDLDHIMTTAPRYHSIILIKEFWRAGKRLCDKHVGVVHETRTQIEDTNVTSQGLIGRLCGNDKHSGDGAPHAFCNTGLIHDYLAWIDAKGDYSAVLRYKSKNLNAKKGRITSKESFVHHSNVEGVDFVAVDDLTTNKPTDPETYRIYTDEKIVRKVFEVLAYSFVKPTSDEYGYLQASLRQEARVLSLDEVIKYVPKARGASGGGASSRRYYPCYRNTKDKSTLCYVVIIEKAATKEQIDMIDTKYPSIPYDSGQLTQTVQNRVILPVNREQGRLPF